MKKVENLASLVKQWVHGTSSYRLIALAKWTPGHTDIFVLERASKDALGGDNWTEIDRWDTNSSSRDVRCVMASGLAL